MDLVTGYPPQLFQLLADAIPRLCRRAEDLLAFFEGAGVPIVMSADRREALRADPSSVDKREMTRSILMYLNERGEKAATDRASVLRRVVEFEEFSTCWPADQLKARELVTEIRRLADVKDTLPRLEVESDDERRKRIELQQAAAGERRAKRVRLLTVQKDLSALFTEPDRSLWGRALEGVLNRLFTESGVPVTEAFTCCGDGEGDSGERVEGEIEFGGHHYLVGMRWWDKPLGVLEVSTHLTTVLVRRRTRGILISASGFDAPAMAACRDALPRAAIVLLGLDEIVLLLEREADLRTWLEQRIGAAIAPKSP